MTEQNNMPVLQAKIQALEELLGVSETSFLQEAEKLEEANGRLQKEIEVHQQLENDIRQILECAGDAVLVIDRHRRIIYVNKMFRDIAALLHRENIEAAPEVNAKLQEIMSTGKQSEEEVKITDATGRQCCYRRSNIPYRNQDHELVGMIRRYRDITKEKQAAAVAEENALQKGRLEMTSDMLHDIGNALAGINVSSLSPQRENEWLEIGILKQLDALFASIDDDLHHILGQVRGDALHVLVNNLIDSLNNRQNAARDSAQKIFRSVDHIKNILDLHHYYARDQLNTHAAVIDLRQLLGDAITIFSGKLEKRHIWVRIACPGEPPRVSGDRTRLMRLFLNIIKNCYEAFDAIPEPDQNDHKLEIRLDTTADATMARVIFIDNAIGFSPEVGARLFVRGFTTKANGTGVGLPECRSIAESHGGRITMTSNGPNTGTTSIVELPLQRNDKEL
ncbi:MAG: ATP-binding protein [Victivallales bacterium]|nr:ATP-binding protein [Victivallales bacterium]